MKQMIAGLIQNGMGHIGRNNRVEIGDLVFPIMPAAVQGDAHVFDRVADAADEEVAPKRAGQAQLRAGAGFVINIVGAFKIQLVPVKVHAQRQFAVQKPRLDEREFVVLALACPAG